MVDRVKFIEERVFIYMEILKTRKLKESVFCSNCEKERKHTIVTYQNINENNEECIVEMRRCKACGKEQSLM